MCLITLNSADCVLADALLLDKLGKEHASNDLAVEGNNLLTNLLGVANIEVGGLSKVKTSFIFPKHVCDLLATDGDRTSDGILCISDMVTDIIEDALVVSDRSLKHFKSISY